MILIIDNYDSFTYNLVQYVGEMGYLPFVARNNKISIAQISELHPTKIIISPGPGSPDASGISLEVIREFGSTIPILGVCLGHQAIGQAYGASIIQSAALMHGKVSEVHHTQDNVLFKNIPSPFVATRYHSLIIDSSDFPDILEAFSYTEDNIIMSVQHKVYKFVFGIQFHPESIKTHVGKTILKNFLELN
uniref:anthranilate synthase component 2 n=1 Tax=Pseudoerythrocladia kornmannii TaxID=753682 RepID=UPI001BED55F3|nr:anthranilate synthase component 2 [Pseudoerythrocladia kornmannii]QUE28361.1 trpG [Pseudoerythrocladia kornmannii]UNJ16676.1 anthranilate synthase component 2 [Pseudoerythrocladia kornmannii]